MAQSSQLKITSLLSVYLPYLQYNFLHLFVRRLELSLQDEHHFPGVVVSVLGVHERDQVTDGLQEGSQTLRDTTHMYYTQSFLYFQILVQNMHRCANLKCF